MRQAARRDSVEADIVDALVAIGVTVYRISGAGIPDLLTFDTRGRATWRGTKHQWLPLECKKVKGKLTPAQRATLLRSPFPTVTTVHDALEIFLGHIHL